MSLPKCEYCGDLVDGEPYTIEPNYDKPYCSDRCADKAYRQQLELQNEGADEHVD